MDMKQYLIMVTEEGVKRFGQIFRGDLQFIEVQGMGVGGHADYNLLVTPVKPVVPMADIAAVEQPGELPATEMETTPNM